jgi:hypothetical protein
MTARFEPHVRYAAAGLILTVLIAAAFFFWLGIPILVLWGLSKATDSGIRHSVLGLIAVPLAMIAYAPFLLWLNTLYLRVTAPLPIEHAKDRRGRPQGPLEPLLLATLLVGFVAMLVWFLVFARNPLSQVV